MSNGYFRTETGRKIHFKDIAQAIDTLHPRYRGKHIFDQLEVLGLYAEFKRGKTPCGLPYSFTECLEETSCSGSSPREVGISSKQSTVAQTFG